MKASIVFRSGFDEKNMRLGLTKLCLEFLAFWGGGVAAQEGNGSYQDQDEESEEAQLEHASSKDAGALHGPGSTFCECGGFQGNHQDAPNGSDQADYEEWFGNQIM